MRCCQCQKELPDGALFCKYCGARQTPQEAEEARKEAPQAETIPSAYQPAASPAVEREMPRAVAAGETEELPALFIEETGECPPEDATLEAAPQAEEATGRPSAELEIKPEREPEPPLALVADGGVQPKLPMEEPAPAKAEEMPGPAVASAPPAPELRFQDSPEEMGQPPAQPEPENLVFDLDQVLQEIAPADTTEPKSRETEPSAEKKEFLWFDPDEVGRPTAEVENTEPDPETALLEANQNVTPEHGEEAAVPAEPEAAATGEPTEPPVREIPAAEQVVLSDEEPPASNPETELHATEQKEDVATLAKQTCIHAEQRASLPVEEYRPEQHEKSTAPAGTKPQGVSGEPVKEVSKKWEKKPVLPILWRLAVIAVELGVITYLSVHLFF